MTLTDPATRAQLRTTGPGTTLKARVLLCEVLRSGTSRHAVAENERSGDDDPPVARQRTAMPHQEVRLHDRAAARRDRHGPHWRSAASPPRRALTPRMKL
jgi:hypothetical protein